MQVSKEKICKCGHSKIDHKDKPESRLSSTGECKRCKCSDYLNRKYPNKASKLLVIFGFFAVGFFVLNSVMIISIASSVWNEPIKINTGTFAVIASSIFILMCLILYNSTLFDYFKEKKRKEYPIE